MKITKDIIRDLFPLYVANECSPDTRALVEEYFRSHPAEVEALQRVLSTSLPSAPPAAALDEARSFREARRRLRRRSWLLGLAICFSLAPFSFFANDEKTWWLFRESPKGALVYGALGLLFWLAYALERLRSRAL